ncbi:acyl-CoA carboxylase subunit epsilon [Sanguibacter sp. A247]|uniref:acyl-CoA carboxylase subunit epsilon n=1 Tax=unclassified Sanguibacter TaxID=2645534 RepID=UPI003FD81AF9
MTLMTDAFPGVRVLRGAPDDLELVALVAGLASASPDDPVDETRPPRPVWGRDRGIRGAQAFGVADDTWRWSLQR